MSSPAPGKVWTFLAHYSYKLINRLMKRVLLCLLAVISLTSAAQNRADRVVLEDPGSSTLILFGDPQAYMKYDINQPIFELTTAWVADNVENLNIKALLCTGA